MASYMTKQGYHVINNVFLSNPCRATVNAAALNISLKYNGVAFYKCVLDMYCIVNGLAN